MSEASAQGGISSCRRRLTRLFLGLVLFLLLLLLSFVLGAIYGREVFPFLFQRAHDGLNQVTDRAHEELQKVNEQLEKKISPKSEEVPQNE